MRRVTSADRLGRRTWAGIGRRVLTLALLATIVACSERVDIPRTLPDAAILTIREGRRIDGNTQLLGPVTWAVVGPSDEIFVGHQLDARIIAFDSSGSRRKIFGGPGRDIGQFQNLMRGGTVGDTLWVYDGVLRRVTMFGPDLQLARSFAWPPPYDEQSLASSRDASVPYLLGLTPQGSVVASVYRERISPATADSLNLPSDGEALFVPPGRSLLAYHQVPPNVAWDGEFLLDNIRPFPNDPVFGAASDGTAFVYVEAFVEGTEAGTFRVTRFDDKGETVFIRQHPFYPVAIPRQVREGVVQQAIRQLRGRGRPAPGAIKTLRERIQIPPVYPPILSVLPGRDGTTWIRMRSLVEGNSEYYVLDPSGYLVGQLSTPGDLDIVAAELRRIWSVSSDTVGVQSVVVHAVDGYGAISGSR